jgi:hypothetical protein
MNWILGIWITGISLALSMAMASHLTAIQPTPAPETMPIAEVFESNHFVSVKCACSKKVIEHLQKRGAMKEANETVYLIGNDGSYKEGLLKAGFKVEEIDEVSADSNFHVEAIPFLRVTSFGKVLYAGAYGKDQKHSPVYQDVEIIGAALRGENRDALPLFGCINGTLRKNKMDSWGLKYGSN